MRDMTKYLAILNGSADESDEAELTDEQQMEFMQAWGAWAQAHESALIDPGSPLFRKRRLSHQGVDEFEDNRVAYAIVAADTHDAAVEMFREHPHLSLMPGNSIDIVECPAVPEM